MNEYQDMDTMTLELDDGTEQECVVLTIFAVREKQYIALLPMNDAGEVDDDALIYLYIYQESEDGEIQLNQIEDDAEYEEVSEYLDSALYD